MNPTESSILIIEPDKDLRHRLETLLQFFTARGGMAVRDSADLSLFHRWSLEDRVSLPKNEIYFRLLVAQRESHHFSAVTRPA